MVEEFNASYEGGSWERVQELAAIHEDACDVRAARKLMCISTTCAMQCMWGYDAHAAYVPQVSCYCARVLGYVLDPGYFTSTTLMY
jgi:hypothetical protein